MGGLAHSSLLREHPRAGILDRYTLSLLVEDAISQDHLMCFQVNSQDLNPRETLISVNSSMMRWFYQLFIIPHYAGLLTSLSAQFMLYDKAILSPLPAELIPHLLKSSSLMCLHPGC